MREDDNSIYNNRPVMYRFWEISPLWIIFIINWLCWTHWRPPLKWKYMNPFSSWLGSFFTWIISFGCIVSSLLLVWGVAHRFISNGSSIVSITWWTPSIAWILAMIWFFLTVCPNVQRSGWKNALRPSSVYPSENSAINWSLMFLIQ